MCQGPANIYIYIYIHRERDIDREELITWISKLVTFGVARRWFAVICGGSRRVAVIRGSLRHAKSLGKTCDFCKWTRPKSDPTTQMEIQMQMQVQMQVQTQFQCKCKCTCTCKCKCKRNFNAKVARKVIPALRKIIKIVGENKCFLKTDQSDSKATLIYSKCLQSDPKVHKVTPT